MKSLILFVDDNKEFVLSMKLLLEGKDYEVVTAYNGKKALEELSRLENIPNIIISDIMMPVMNGYDFYLKVSQNRKWVRIPFLFLSAKTEIEDVRFGKMLGVDDYISKPCKIEEILTRIEFILDQRRENLETSEKINDKLIEAFKFRDPMLNTIDKIKFIFLYYLKWEDGKPKIINRYPTNEIPSINLDKITTQSYSSMVKIYKKTQKFNEYFFSLTMSFLDEYILLNWMNEGGGINNDIQEYTYMLCAITPNLHYLQGERIKEILKEISVKINKNRDWDIKEFWEKLTHIYEMKF